MLKRWHRGAAAAAVTLFIAAEPAREAEAQREPPQTLAGPAGEASARPAAPPPPSPQVLALGRRLARGCTSCHRIDGVERGIPRISADRLAAALEAYRTGARDNPVMGSVARTLPPDAVAALAAYYASLRRP
ncbi:MAG: hypothetical protein NW223_19640 [Hyphomicrobiaceae bacterium]|nr:hypothetical protein [Hyphomicrobiaceae bacterium]